MTNHKRYNKPNERLGDYEKLTDDDEVLECGFTKAEHATTIAELERKVGRSLDNLDIAVLSALFAEPGATLSMRQTKGHPIPDAVIHEASKVLKRKPGQSSNRTSEQMLRIARADMWAREDTALAIRGVARAVFFAGCAIGISILLINGRN